MKIWKFSIWWVMTNLDFHDIFGSQRPAHFCTGQPKSDAHLTASGHFVPGAVGHMRRCFIHWKILTCRATHTHILYIYIYTYVYTYIYIHMYIYIYIDTYIQYLYTNNNERRWFSGQTHQPCQQTHFGAIATGHSCLAAISPVARTPPKQRISWDFP